MQTEINYEQVNELYEENKNLKKQILDDMDGIKQVRKKVKNIFDGSNDYFCDNLKKNCDLFEDIINVYLEPCINNLKTAADNYKTTDKKMNNFIDNYNQVTTWSNNNNNL